MKAKITSTFGSVLKMDSTKKVVASCEFFHFSIVNNYYYIGLLL